MTIAAIDIGTNTVLLLVARVDEQEQVETLAYEQRSPRLGRGVDEHRNITRTAMEAAVRVMMEYRVIATSYKAERIVACATSAVRDAKNRRQFISYMKSKTGMDLEILTGDEEALMTYRGAVSGIRELEGQATVIDIGGGSMEVIVGGRSTIQRHMSLDTGSVRITERYLKTSPPETDEVEKALEAIQNEFSRLADFDFTGSTLVGVAGTVTTVAALAQGLDTFDLSKIAGYRLSKDAVGWVYRMIRTKKPDEIQKLSDVVEGRADILFAGVLILQAFMERFKFESVITSERGVRYGLALREWEAKIQK